MTDILIRDMEMPNVGEKIEFTQNIAGRIYAKFNPSRGYMCEVIELPEHGDLVEADHLRTIAYARGKEYGCVAFVDPIDIAIAPVIIPSNKENKNAD